MINSIEAREQLAGFRGVNQLTNITIGGIKMSITLEQAKALQYGDMIHHRTNTNANGTPQKWRVNGKVKRWKREPDRIRVPLKHGLYTYDYLTENELDIVNMGVGY